MGSASHLPPRSSPNVFNLGSPARDLTSLLCARPHTDAHTYTPQKESGPRILFCGARIFKHNHVTNQYYGSTHRWASIPFVRQRDDLLQCQKRPTTVSKETYYSVKRDLLPFVRQRDAAFPAARVLQVRRTQVAEQVRRTQVAERVATGARAT